MEEPLIHTSKGNLPVASLRYAHSWEDTPREIIFAEEYYLGDELVRRSAHVYLKKGVSAGMKQGGFGG